MLVKMFCNANWDMGLFILPLRHSAPSSPPPTGSLRFHTACPLLAGFCLSSLVGLPHPTCQALLVLSFNKFWRHKVSLTDHFLLEPLSAIVGAALRC